MEKLRIPDRYKPGLEKLVTLDNKTVDQLLHSLKEIFLLQPTEDLSSVVALQVEGLTKEEIKDVINTLVSLNTIKEYSDASINDVVDKISDAVKRDQELADILNLEEQKQEFQRRLASFLQKEDNEQVADNLQLSKVNGEPKSGATVTFGSVSRVDIEATFTALVNQWREETRGISSTNEMSMHPAYQQIIGMGEVAIPLLLRELEKKSGRWFWALGCITREDPVPAESRGKTREMIQAWLDWGRQRGYRW